MYRRILLLLLSMLFCASAAIAQRPGSSRPGPEFWRKAACEPLEPRTKLEALEDRHSTVIVKGFTRITTVEVRGVRVDAIEMRELGNVARAKGIAVVLTREAGERTNERPDDNRAFVDYEEIDSLLNAIDAISRVDESATKLVGFEARYKTQGDLEIGVFRQTRSGTAVVIQTGICDRTTQTLSLDDLAKVKAIIQEAKSRLDEIR